MLLASVSGTLLVPGSISDLSKRVQPCTNELNGISSMLLRSHEERGIPVSSIEHFKNLFTSSKISEKKLQSWLKSGKTADRVFVRLKLDKAKTGLFDKPHFAAWVKYMDELSATQPRSREPTISTLKTYYGDEALSQVINAAQKNPSTQTLATELQTRQLQYWLNDRRAPADVLKLLGLTKTGDNLFDNPQFVTWLIYVADYNSKNSRKAIPRISILTSNYGDDALSKMVVEAKKTSSTATIAAKLQAEQIQHWLDIQKSPGDVFKFLALNKAGDKLLDNPQFSAWVKYVDDLNKANIDEKTTLMSVLATHYNSEGLVNILKAATNVPASSKVVKRLKTEQKWLTKDTLDELFKRLKLDKAGNDVLINPQLKTWISYMKEYNMANPKYQTTLIGTLVKNYGDENLAKILEAATKVKSMASTAKILQNEQFQLWMKKGWSPNAIFNVLHLDKAGDKLLSNPLVVTWNKYLSAFNWENPDKKTTLWEILKYHDYSDDSVGVSTCSSEKDSGY